MEHRQRAQPQKPPPGHYRVRPRQLRGGVGLAARATRNSKLATSNSLPTPLHSGLKIGSGNRDPAGYRAVIIDRQKGLG